MSGLDRDLAKIRDLKLESVSAQDGVRKLISQLETSRRQEELNLQEQQRRKQQHLLHQQQQEQAAKLEGLSVKGLDRWNVAQFQPSSEFERIILACHCYALDCGFVCLEEMKNNTPGFAPSLREVPATKFISETWHKDGTMRTLLYKHAATKKRFDMSFDFQPGSSLVKVLVKQKGGADGHMEIPLSWCASEEHAERPGTSPHSLFLNDSDLESSFKGVLSSFEGVLPQSTPVSATKVSDDEAAMSIDDNGISRPLRPSNPSNPNVGVGAGDVFPNFQGPSGGMFPNPEAGNLVGPGHPLFGSSAPQRNPGYPGLPQPRFDPYGPVPGPNGPMFGGLNPRGEHGVPDPDHLKPPDLPDMPDPGSFNFPGRGRGRGRGRGGVGGGGRSDLSGGFI